MSLWNIAATRRYGILFGALLFVLVGAPAVALPASPGWGIWALFLVLMLAALNALRDEPRALLLVVVALVFAYAGLLLWDVVAPDRALRVTAHLVGLVLLGFVVVRLVPAIFRAENVTTDLLLGAASMYLLLGLFWSRVYIVLDVLWPGSFAISERLLPYVVDAPLGESSALVYFSFVTLTTVGYGDVTPVTEVARRAALAEAITGQLFIAITVARLVGAYVAPRRTPEP